MLEPLLKTIDAYPDLIPAAAALFFNSGTLTGTLLSFKGCIKAFSCVQLGSNSGTAVVVVEVAAGGKGG